MPDEPEADIALGDELLELLYWLEGEGSGGESNLASIARFLTYDASIIEPVLEGLRARGDVTVWGSPPEYELTEVGRREAARRFAEEFPRCSTRVKRECSDPNCDCHTPFCDAIGESCEAHGLALVVELLEAERAGQPPR